MGSCSLYKVTVVGCCEGLISPQYQSIPILRTVAFIVLDVIEVLNSEQDRTVVSLVLLGERVMDRGIGKGFGRRIHRVRIDTQSEDGEKF